MTGTTKGKGFAGTIKRWGFKSYRRTHGSHKNERRPGSVGACATPSLSLIHIFLSVREVDNSWRGMDSCHSCRGMWR